MQSCRWRALTSLSLSLSFDALSYFVYIHSHVCALINMSSTSTRSLSYRNVRSSPPRVIPMSRGATRAYKQHEPVYYSPFIGYSAPLLILSDFISLLSSAQHFSKTTFHRTPFDARIEYELVTCNVDARYCSPRRIDRLRQRVSDPGIFSL